MNELLCTPSTQLKTLDNPNTWGNSDHNNFTVEGNKNKGWKVTDNLDPSHYFTFGPTYYDKSNPNETYYFPKLITVPRSQWSSSNNGYLALIGDDLTVRFYGIYGRLTNLIIDNWANYVGNNRYMATHIDLSNGSQIITIDRKSGSYRFLDFKGQTIDCTGYLSLLPKDITYTDYSSKICWYYIEFTMESL